MNTPRKLRQGVWYDVRTEINIGASLFWLPRTTVLLYRTLLETMARFGFALRGLRLDGAWLTFSNKPGNGLELPKIMQWVKQIYADYAHRVRPNL